MKVFALCELDVGDPDGEPIVRALFTSKVHADAANEENDKSGSEIPMFVMQADAEWKPCL